MSQVALRLDPDYGAPVKKARLQIQKPEISTYRPPLQSAQPVSVGFAWKLMVGLTYLFSFITFYFVFTV